MIESSPRTRCLNINFRVESRKKKERGLQTIEWRIRKSLCTLSADTTTLFVFDAVACAQSSFGKGSSWCKAENPRYKCQVRLSAFHLSPSFLFAPLVFRHRGRNCLFRYPSTRLYLLLHSLFSSDSLLSRIFRSLLPASASPIFLLARNFDSSRSLSSIPISISIVLKSSP